MEPDISDQLKIQKDVQSKTNKIWMKMGNKYIPFPNLKQTYLSALYHLSGVLVTEDEMTSSHLQMYLNIYQKNLEVIEKELSNKRTTLKNSYEWLSKWVFVDNDTFLLKFMNDRGLNKYSQIFTLQKNLLESCIKIVSTNTLIQ